MTNPKKRRGKGLVGPLVPKHKRRLPESPFQQTQVRVLGREEISPTREAKYIIERAQQHDSRAVVLGELVFFSTATGDAWMLDAEDDLAICLARDGQPQPYQIMETPTRFAIDWQAPFALEGETFVVQDRSGSTRAIVGYPVAAIQQALETARIRRV
jgi:hypothetical protein